MPSYRNLRHIVRHQADISNALLEAIGRSPLDNSVRQYFLDRRELYLGMFREMRNLNGNVGRGTDSVTLSADVASRLRFAAGQALNPSDRNIVAALASASRRVDDAVGAAVLNGLRGGLLVVPASRRTADEIASPEWEPVHGIQRASWASPQLAWVKADLRSQDLPIADLANRLRSSEWPETPPTPRPVRSRGKPDALDRQLARTGTGYRPERPNSR